MTTGYTDLLYDFGVKCQNHIIKSVLRLVLNANSLIFDGGCSYLAQLGMSITICYLDNRCDSGVKDKGHMYFNL